MNAEERLQKLKNDLVKMEEKEKKIAGQIKEIKTEISAVEKRITVEKNESIVAMIEEKIGTVDEEKMKKLNLILEEQSGKFSFGLENKMELNMEDPEKNYV